MSYYGQGQGQQGAGGYHGQQQPQPGGYGYGQPAYPQQQQPGYSQPPPGMYNAPPPQPQYGQQAHPAPGAPPQGYSQYNAPPQQQYPAPMGQQSFGAPAPPPVGYGHAQSFQQPQQYAQPGYNAPGPAYGHGQSPAPQTPTYLGAQLAGDPLQPYAQVPLSLPSYDPSNDVELIRKATKGFGTNENVLHTVLCKKPANQVEVLRQAFKNRHGKELVELLQKELRGYHEQIMCTIAMGPLEADAKFLRDSLSGAGTKESVVTEILVGRHPNELVLLRATYKKIYNRSMDDDVLNDLSLKTKSAFGIVLQGRWQDNGYVDQNLIQQDINQLMPSFRLGSTDEMLISSIIFARSPVYLQALVEAFKQRSGKTLTKQIKQHFSGHLEQALLFAVNGGRKDGLGIWREGKGLEAAMAGMGTADYLLALRVVRLHWNPPKMAQVKLAYKQKYKRDLIERVKGETSGHYRDSLVAILQG